MAFYTIGEVALPGLTPVTLRVAEALRIAEPQRTDGGHRLFNDADTPDPRDQTLDRQRQVSKAKCCSVMKMLMCRTAGAISKKHY